MSLVLAALAGVYVVCGALVFGLQRSLLYLPSHHAPSGALREWQVDGQTVGYCREVTHPRAIWMMTHGNAGQASERDYVLGSLPANASLYILEYPGYGQRAGSPSRDSINAAALLAYLSLRGLHPGTSICLLGESIGSGPACYLSSASPPPDKIVLVVPFDTLSSVAQDHMPVFPAGMMLRDRWNNIESLRGYRGPVEIYGAAEDTVIPIAHARRLAEATHARFTEIPMGHNDWSMTSRVRLD
jgi:pimeloyl-ACP methyl ester carboxylesterase